MNEEHSTAASQQLDVRVVYRRETGEIVHIHRAMAIPGVELPNENTLRAAAIENAVKSTKEDGALLETLSISEEALTPGLRYKVDVENKLLTAENVEKRDGE